MPTNTVPPAPTPMQLTCMGRGRARETAFFHLSNVAFLGWRRGVCGVHVKEAVRRVCVYLRCMCKWERGREKRGIEELRYGVDGGPCSHVVVVGRIQQVGVSLVGVTFFFSAGQ